VVSVLLLMMAFECLVLLVLTLHVCFPQQQMSMVLTTVTHLNQAKAEATDSERCTIKTEIGTDTANEEEGANNENSSSMSTIKRREGLCNQVMTNQDSSAAIRLKDIDNGTARGVMRKRNAEDSSFENSSKKGTAARTGCFEYNAKQLIDFIDEFGQCNVPCRYSVNPSFGNWCSRLRCSYNQIQQGQTPKNNFTQDQIERLEGIGFIWKITGTFEQRCHDLEAFKIEFWAL